MAAGRENLCGVGTLGLLGCDSRSGQRAGSARPKVLRASCAWPKVLLQRRGRGTLRGQVNSMAWQHSMGRVNSMAAGRPQPGAFHLVPGDAHCQSAEGTPGSSTASVLRTRGGYGAACGVQRSTASVLRSTAHHHAHQASDSGRLYCTPSPATTSPRTKEPGTAARAAGASGAATTRTKPTPMLKVRNISASLTPPARSRRPR